MKMEDQGIMALAPGAQMQGPTAQPAIPVDPAAEAAFEQARMQIDPKEFGDELLGTAAQVDPNLVAQFKQSLDAVQLPPEVLDALGQIVDEVLADPGRYAEIRAEYLNDPDIGDVMAEVLPPEFDAVYFGALNMALDQMSGSMAAPAQPVQQFAQGGIVNLKPIAAEMAKMGRNGDSMLAHITRSEARMLRRRGGSGTINPATGLPEFFFKKIKKAVSSAFKSVKKAISGVVKSIKNFVKSDLGRMIATVALGFFVGPAAAGMLGVSSAAGIAAVSGFVGGFGSTMLAGGSVKDALKAGAIGGVTAGAVSGVMGGSAAFQANPNAPTTFMGGLEQQVDKFTGALDSLAGTANTPAQVGPGSVSATTGVTTPTAPTAPTGAFDAGQFAPTDMVGATPTGAFDAGQFVPTDMAPASPPAIQTTQPTNYSLLSEAQPPQAPTVEPMVDYSLPTTPSTGLAAPQPSMFDVASAGQPGSALPPVQGVGGTAVPTASTQAAQQPGFFESLMEGKPIDAAKAAYSNVVDFYNPQSGPVNLDASAQKYGYSSFNAVPEGPARAAVIKAAESAAAPTFGTTSRLLGTSLGALALSGGFNQEPVEPPGIIPPETGSDLLAQDPQKYGVRLGGAQTTYAPDPYLSMTRPGEPSPLQMPLFNVRDPRSYLDPRLFAFAPTGMQTFAQGGEVQDAQQAASKQRSQGLGKFLQRDDPETTGRVTETVPERAGFFSSGFLRQVIEKARNAALAERARFAPAVPVSFQPGGAMRFADGGQVSAPRTPKFGDIEAIRQGIMAASKVQDMTRFRRDAPVAFRPGNMGPRPPVVVEERRPELSNPGISLPLNYGGWAQMASKTGAVPLGSESTNFANAKPLPFRPGGAAPAARFAMGGIANLPTYKAGGPANFPRRTGQISGPGTETSDDIPAMLSDGEFVMTAKAVRGAGGGSRREGAKRMYKMMHALERKA
jgi:hypothetical protein